MNDDAEQLGLELLKESADDGDGDILSGMFDALPGVSQSSDVEDGDGNSNGVTVRDFGKLTGMNPKRVLEEACRARDARCKVAYTMVSATTYASRHSATIKWAKEQDLFEHSFVTCVSVSSKPTSTTITMAQVATPDVGQSEAYVATVALFLIFSGLPSPRWQPIHPGTVGLSLQ